MKRQFIDFSKVQYRSVRKFAPELKNRANGYGSGVCYRSGGEEEEEEEEEEEKDEQAKLLKRIEKRVAKQLAGRATTEQISAINKQLIFLTKDTDENGKEVDAPFPIETLREMADEKTGVLKKMVEMGTRMAALELQVSNPDKPTSIRSQVKKWMEDNKNDIEAIIGKEKRNLKPLNIRVADSPMSFATVNAGSSPYIGSTEIEKPIYDFLRLARTFWNILPKGRTSARTYVWVNKTNPQGAAGFIGPGVAKPGISLAIEAETSTAKKIAVSAKTGTELLQDIDGMTDFITMEMREQLEIELNSKLMSSAGSSTVPKGIQNYSFAYADYANPAAIKTTNPNFVDSIRAVVGQMRSGAIQGPIDVFINSIDAANMDLAKAVDSGVYILPPFVTANGRTIGGATITEDNNIPVGYFQAAFLRFYRILIYQDFSISWGWENDDFTKNLVTAVAEMRLHQFVNSIHEESGVFCYDTFDNVKLAITQV